MTNHIFFSDADFGPEECYAYLNTKADISGNCGSGASGYIRCKTKYALRNLFEKLYCFKLENTTR